MPRTPKRNPKVTGSETNEPQKDSWGKDQQNREYYYDDAHGYEVYVPDEEDEQKSPDPKGPGSDGDDDKS